jgi:hypothetical protein
VLGAHPHAAPVRDHPLIDSSLREQNRTVMVVSGEHPAFLPAYHTSTGAWDEPRGSGAEASQWRRLEDLV